MWASSGGPGDDAPPPDARPRGDASGAPDEAPVADDEVLLLVGLRRYDAEFGRSGQRMQARACVVLGRRWAFAAGPLVLRGVSCAAWRMLHKSRS